MRVIVIGGYGNFGARICRALVRDGIETVATGRDPERGHREAGFDSRVGKAWLDMRAASFIADLRALAPGIVIHCAGPFQGQGYSVAEASLAAGAHYIDLADGRAFVAGFAEAMDGQAKAAKKLAVSGASTLPALSSAVVDTLKNRFVALEEIQSSIAPAQQAPRGTATLQAVFSYVGQPFLWLDQGTLRTAFGWQELKRFHFADFGSRWAAACDVPDLELFPLRYPGVQTVQFRAALEFGIEHFVLAAVGGLRRLGIPVPIERWAGPLDRLVTRFDKLGGQRGGMLVRLKGLGEGGEPLLLEWHLTADSNHGPEIPCMAAILMAKKLVQGRLKSTGAMPCMGLLTLDDFAAEFARWDIRTQVRETDA